MYQEREQRLDGWIVMADRSMVTKCSVCSVSLRLVAVRVFGLASNALLVVTLTNVELKYVILFFYPDCKDPVR